MSAPTTPLSANEVRFFFTRAAVGAGAPWGLGDEAASAALWLASAGIDPAAVMAPALTALRDGRSSGRIEPIVSGPPDCLGVAGGGVASALFAGPALADALALSPSATVLRVDAPLLAVAALGALRPDRIWLVTLGDTITVTLTPDSVTCAPGFHAVMRLCAPISVSVGPGKASAGETRDLVAGRRAVIDRGVTVGAAGWDVIEACFRNCLVPSDSASRAAGAGAGLTDND